MILTKTPLRISLGGGGTDIKDFYREEKGAVLSATINRYMYIMLNHRFDNRYRAAYSNVELVEKPEDFKHPLIRGCMGFLRHGVDIASVADVPEASGLGSSSAFAVGLLHAVSAFSGEFLSNESLAERACEVEIGKAGEHIGKQDQYAVAFGGLNLIEFNPNGSVVVNPVNCSSSVRDELNRSLMLVFVGNRGGKSAGDIIDSYDFKKKKKVLQEQKEIAYEMVDCLESGKGLDDIGLLLNEGWKLKKSMSRDISDEEIELVYEAGIRGGALGGKLCFTPNTTVKTAPGFYQTIESIKTGDRVYDHQNKLQKVNKVIKRDYKGQMLGFKIKGLENELCVTHEHPILTTIKHPQNKRHGRKIINLGLFKEAQSFKKGDVFLVPVNSQITDIQQIEVPRETTQSKYSKYDIYTGIPRELKVDSDLLTILGWYIAEGSANKLQFQFVLGGNEIQEAKQIVHSFGLLFSRNITLKKFSNKITLVGSSKVLADFFQRLCGKYAEHKMIPLFIMDLPIKKQAVLLRALWKGDGSVQLKHDKRTNQDYRVCCYKTISHFLAKQIQELCFRLGYICSIKREKKRAQRKISYVVSIHGDDAKAFKEFIDSGSIVSVKRKNNCKLSLKKEFVEIDGNVYAKRSILSIRSMEYKGKVMNLEVNHSHTYIAGDIAVHNCGAGGKGFMLFFVEPYNRERIRKALYPLKEIAFRFESVGSKATHVN